MANKEKTASATDWEDLEKEGGWESLPSGFAPLWKPEKGDSIIFTPVDVHPFKSTKKKGKKSISKINFAIQGIFKGGASANFYSGKSKDNAISVKAGDMVSVGSSYNLVGEDKLIVEVKEGEARLSRMSELIIKDNVAFRLIFNGKIHTSGVRSVNDFTIQVPPGYRQKFTGIADTVAPSKKRTKTG